MNYKELAKYLTVKLQELDYQERMKARGNKSDIIKSIDFMLEELSKKTEFKNQEQRDLMNYIRGVKFVIGSYGAELDLDALINIHDTIASKYNNLLHNKD